MPRCIPKECIGWIDCAISEIHTFETTWNLVVWGVLVPVVCYGDSRVEGCVGSRSISVEIHSIFIIILHCLFTIFHFKFYIIDPFIMLPTPSSFVGESFVQVATILGVLCGCRVVMVHGRIAAVCTLMNVPSMCVAVVLISTGFGSSAIIILG